MRMDEPRVRAFRPADAEAVATVRRAAVPHLVCTARTVAWEASSAPAEQRLRWLVAERTDGTVTGCADARLWPDDPEPGTALLHIAVHPEAAGFGTGGALAAAAEAYLTAVGARRIFTWAADDGYSPAFAERRGYHRRRRARFLGLDLTRTELPPLPEHPPLDARLLTGAGLGDRLPALHTAELACTADEPGDVRAEAPSYPEWLRQTWHRPDLDHHLTTLALVGGEVAAYTLAQTDGRERYWSGMTGTLRAYRGRGLARLVKLASLHRARAAGYAHACTGNDAQNAPMLAVNRSLGYTPAGAEWRYAKEL